MKYSETATTQFLVITSGEHCFALPAGCVQKILSTLPVTPIPFVHTCIDGLVNVDGAIAIQINLATLCRTTTHASRTELILIETGRALYALQAERIVERTALTPQPLHTDNTPITNTLLAGEAAYKNGTIYILAPQCIGTLIQTGSAQSNSTGALGKMIDTQGAEEDATIACLAVGVGNDEYALELQSVIEILEVDAYTPIPNAPTGLLGFSLLRNQTIPVIALASLVGVDTAASTEQAWLIVVEREGAHYGLLVNQLRGVKKFPFDSFQPVVDGNQHISGLFIHENTTTLLLSPRQIIADGMVSFLAPYITQHQQVSEQRKEESGSFLKIMLCQKPFVIPLHNVKRIVPFFPMNHLDNKTDNICGAINIDGKVIPVLSIEKILKIDQQHTRNEYIIVGDATQDWAICVDAAQYIVNIPLSQIHSETIVDARPLSGIALIDGELIPLINPNLFSHQRITQVVENTQ